MTVAKTRPTQLESDVFYENSEERLRELILYIADQCQDEDTFSATMLNKVLWRADFEAFGLYGMPITGIPYVKLPYGPIPNNIEKLKDKMKADGDIVERERPYYNKKQRRVLPVRCANLELFDGNQIALVSYWAKKLCQFNASTVSAFSHDRAWKAAIVGEVIPYHTVIISDEPITELDIFNTRLLAKKYGWTLSA